LVTTLSVGDSAPDFALTDQHGEIIRLSDLTGSPVVVYFYPKAGTTKCTQQACDFRDNFDALSGAGVTVLGISLDQPRELAIFGEEQQVPYSLLSDSGATAMEWGAWGERPVAGIAGTGVIRSSFIVDAAGKLSYVAYDVDPDGHVQALRSQLGV
jgi:peroxiredoxin Q/BCP